MSKLKIAVLIDWYLPGTKAGGPVRSIHSMLELLKSEYEFYLITQNTDLGSNIPYNNITADRLFEKDGVSYFYFSAEHMGMQQMETLLRQIDPDLVYINSFWSFRFSILPVLLKRFGKLKAPLLLAPRGMLGKGALGLKSWKKSIFLAVSRLAGMYRGISFHASQSQELEDIRKAFPDARIFIAPNINASPPAHNTTPKQPGEARLFYLSRIAAVKNLHFALEVLSRLPGDLRIVYDIYGNAEDKTYLGKCRQLTESLPPNVQVNFRGEIAFDQIQRVIGGYHALFLPTLNENYGHSIVESLLCGCQVLISDQTPWSDVAGHEAGWALALADPDAFAKAIREIADQDETAFRARSAAAINYISGKIDLRKIAGQYRDLFNAATNA